MKGGDLPAGGFGPVEGCVMVFTAVTEYGEPNETDMGALRFFTPLFMHRPSTRSSIR
jgi:hypothetical protein